MPRAGLSPWWAAAAILVAGCYTGFNGDERVATAGSGASAADGGGGDDNGGGDDDGDSDGDPSALCGDPDVGATALRRLTATQYRNTIRDLFGLSDDYTIAFAPDERIGPFKSNSLAPVGELQVEQYMGAAEAVASDAVGSLSTLLPCDASGGDACAQQFIEEIAPRIYRRPLTNAEIDGLVAVYQDGKAEGDFANGIRVVLAAMLQSPYFLYHVEFGVEEGDGAVVVLDDYEVASRLSFFLWNTMPDDALFAAAEAGELSDDEGLAAQVDRMLADPKALDAIGSFHQQWLGVDELELVEKDGTAYPQFSAALAEAMKRETAEFANGVILDGDAKLETLLTGSFTYTSDPDLLALYGATLPAGYQPGDRIELDPTQRAGLLTQAGVMARHAHANQTSPVHRGVLVRTNFLCQTLPPPPPEVDNAPPDPDPNATTRERFAQHTSDPACAGCHVLIDPLGFGLENYDAVGAYRTMEGDLAVDASGEVVAADVTGKFDGGVELAAILAQSDDVRECVAEQWFRFAFARTATDRDDCSMEQIVTAFAEADYDVRVLLRGIALSDAFRHRRIVSE